MMRTQLGTVLLAFALLVACQSEPRIGSEPEPTEAGAGTARAEAAGQSKGTQPTPTRPANELEFTPRKIDFLYEEIVTGRADPDAPLPLIVALHGRGDTPAGFASLLEPLPYPARVLLPRAPDPYGQGFSWFPSAPNDFDDLATARGVLEVLHPLARWIEEMAARRPTVGKPVVTGFSQGGALSFALALRHPNLIAVAVPLGGALPRPLWRLHTSLMAPPPMVFAIHGEQDRTVSVASARALIEDLIARGYQAQLRGYPAVGHALSAQMRRDLLEVLIAAMPSAGSSQDPP